MPALCCSMLSKLMIYLQPFASNVNVEKLSELLSGCHAFSSLGKRGEERLLGDAGSWTTRHTSL